MENMLIRPTRDELATYGTPDFVIYNAGEFPSNKYTKDVSSSTSISINFHLRQMVILGTQYAGEMKKVCVYECGVCACAWVSCVLACV